MSPSGVRYYQPRSDPDQPALHRPTEPAVRGQSFTETYPTNFGPSIGAVLPAFAPNGSIDGLVAAGITMKSLRRTKMHQILCILSVKICINLLACSAPYC